MARPLSRISIGSLAALFAVCFFAGCTKKTGDSSAAVANVFQAKTEGPPGALMSQLTRLQTQLVSTEQADLDEYHANVSAYVAAVVKTTDVLLTRADVADDLRQKALEIKFDAMLRTAEFDPTALGRLLAEADEIEKTKSVESGLLPIAAYYRVVALRDSVDRIKGATDEQYHKIHDALLKLGKAKPPHPQTVLFLSKNAEEFERAGYDKLARDLYLMLADRFADTIEGKFAKGNAERIARKSTILPNIAGKDFNGKPIDLASLRGKVVLIDFWASWCEPCMSEMQYLQKMRDDLGPKGFEILGINLDSEPDRAKQLIKQHKIAWPNIQGIIPNTNSDEIPDAPLALEYGVAGIPFSMIVDREGRYVASGHGVLMLLPKMMPLLTDKKPSTEKEAPKDKTADPSKKDAK